MKQLILNVQEDNLAFLAELLAKFDFVEIVNPPNLPSPKKRKWTKEQQQFYEDLKASFEEMELHRQGKIQLQTADEMIKELWPA